MLPWGGLGCCMGAAALYFMGKNTEREADDLKSSIRVDQLKDIALLFDTARRILPLVAISGQVGSDAPIACKLSGLRGVIVEETEEQNFLKQNEAGSWTQDSVMTISTSNEVPWYLDDGTGRVRVVGARGATGLILTVASQIFEESGRRSLGRALDYLQGLKMLGVKRVERVLPTGTSLTVIGEAVKDDTGTIRVQKPHKGPFYVSPKNIDELIAYLVNWARWCQYASMGFTAFGVFFLVKNAIQYVLERKRRRDLQKRVLAAAAQRQGQDEEGAANSDGGSDNANTESRMPNLCVICLEDDYNAVFVPCGHMCCCMSCSSHLTNCPLCRKRINQVVRTFRH